MQKTSERMERGQTLGSRIKGAPTGCRTFLSELDLLSGQICPIFETVNEPVMDKRDRFIAEIRSEARAMGLSFRVDYCKAKVVTPWCMSATNSPRCRAGKSIPRRPARSE